MEITTEEKIQVRFTVTKDGQSYSDALYFTPADRTALTPEQLAAMQAERFTNWKTVVTAPARERTRSEKQDELTALTDEKVRLEERIAELSADVERVR